MAVTPPGESNKGRRDREGEDIGPPETEYGRAICCNTADSGSWVLTGKMEADLDAFQGRVARRLTGRLPRRGRDGKWQ